LAMPLVAMSCVEPHPGWTISRPIYGPTPTAPKGSRLKTADGQLPALEAAFKPGGVCLPAPNGLRVIEVRWHPGGLVGAGGEAH
jgi:hypothetical protein